MFRIFLKEYKNVILFINMLWFLLGFFWGVGVAQETPHLPNVKEGVLKIYEFVCDIFSDKNTLHANNIRMTGTRSKSE